MSWRNEMDNYAMECEREEARDAIRYAEPFSSCYRHSYVSDGRGGGVCTGCGDTIARDEL